MFIWRETFCTKSTFESFRVKSTFGGFSKLRCRMGCASLYLGIPVLSQTTVWILTWSYKLLQLTLASWLLSKKLIGWDWFGTDWLSLLIGWELGGPLVVLHWSDYCTQFLRTCLNVFSCGGRGGQTWKDLFQRKVSDHLLKEFKSKPAEKIFQ